MGSDGGERRREGEVKGLRLELSGNGSYLRERADGAARQLMGRVDGGRGDGR
jgi:hypothetical protein